MKKLFYLLIPVSLVLALLPTAGFAHTADVPFTTDLMAGQNIDAGDVLVWNDADNLYVQFVTSGDWCITETHLATGASVDDIPTTKKDNPIPGQFFYSSQYAPYPCVDAPDPYVIPLGSWSAGDDVYVAAHAEVVRPVDGCYEQEWQIGYVEDQTCAGGLFTNYANEFNWKKANADGDYVDPVGDCELGPGLSDDAPSFTNPFIVGTTPLDEFPYNSNKSRGYATNFDVQWSGGLPFGGMLTVSWSPGASAMEKKVVSDGFPPAIFAATGSNTPGAGWFVDKYPLVEHSVAVNPLTPGVHTINFEHTQGDGTFWDWIRLEKPCEQWETAWGKGANFDGNNWGMYFIYTVQPVCPEIINTSGSVTLLSAPLADVTLDANTLDNLQLFEEFVGSLEAPLPLDVDGSASGQVAVGT
jgi:hypothetical protein